MYNKKAQVSEGITWIVATLSIIGIIIISVAVTSFYVSGNKEIESRYFAPNLNQKSFNSWLLTEESEGKNVYSKINESGNLNEHNGNLAEKVFNGLYKKDYSEIWVGILVLGEGTLGNSWNIVENDFFGRKPASFTQGSFGNTIRKDSFSLIVPLDEKRILESIFIKNEN